MRVWATIAKALETQGRCAMVTVLTVEGSAPREPGARLIVVPGGFHGTIGGGALEWRAIAAAQAMLVGGPRVRIVSHALGPELGQCCGGRVRLLTEVFAGDMKSEVQELVSREASGSFICDSRIETDRVLRHAASQDSSSRRKPGPNSSRDERRQSGNLTVIGLGPGFRRDDDVESPSAFTETFGDLSRPLFLFGAGHVGRALILALAPLPFAVTWIDSRPDAFPSAMPGNVTPVRADDPVAELAAAPPDAFVLVMTHSHALDLAIVDGALRDPRLSYVGLIGSATKRSRFEKRLREAGVPPQRVAGLVCPIGIAGIGSKTPAAIAASVAAQLLIRDEMAWAEAAPAAAVESRTRRHG